MTPPALAMSKMDSGNGLRETEIHSGHFPQLLEFTPAECERLERCSAHPGPKKKKLSAAGWAKTESSLSFVSGPRLKDPRLKHVCVHVAGQTEEQRSTFLHPLNDFQITNVRREQTGEDFSVRLLRAIICQVWAFFSTRDTN